MEKEMCQNAVAENAGRAKERERARGGKCCTLIRNIWHSFHYRNPRLSQDLSLALSLSTSHLLYIAFLWHFPLILQCIFLFSPHLTKSNLSCKLGQGSLTGRYYPPYKAGGCSVWLLILLGLTVYTCLRQVSHCWTVDMEICSKFNSKYQVAPGKLFEKPRGGGSGWQQVGG